MRPRNPSGCTTWLRRAAGAGLAGVLLTACGSGGTGGAGAAGAVPKPGGRLTFAVTSDFGCLDPQQVSSIDSVYPARQLVDSLTDQDPATGKIVPWLAERWEISPDATTFTFHLRPGATFSDGSPVDARAVKANFDTAGKLGTIAAQAASYLQGYRDTTIVDDLTARVSFSRPAAQFLQATSTHTLGLVSPASTAKPPAERCTSGIVGSGPFTLGSYQKNQSITLNKRADYRWGSTLWKQQGPAYLDQIVFQVIPESGIRNGSLRSGAIDGDSAVASQDEASLRTDGFTLQYRSAPGLPYGFSVNTGRSPLDDTAVRRAVSRAINRQEIVSTVLTPLTKPVTSPLASSTPGYVNLAADLVFAPDEARKLLDDAGWRPGPDGIRVKDGNPLQLTVQYFTGQTSAKAILELIQQQLRAVGIAAALHEEPVTNGGRVVQAKGYDLLWGHTKGADPDVLRAQYSSTGLNFNNLRPGPLDDLLTRQAATADQNARMALVRQAQELILTNQYNVPVIELTVILGLSAKVHDVVLNADARLQFHDTWKS
ncbi:MULTISPECIES: ABC transporter substrate-binding protein [Protofrankia]|uniref:ABC transporter substrate-binding protein n=1 Tax=Protofrankia TaxID=2994361 RepID=UPI00069BFC99|nr:MULTISPECIES: ABC transporter substrate-binding protein [Protofrankia]ONH34244.1 ABC transporter substrate-binding protein [Protofrankia sp. BMG5.30]